MMLPLLGALIVGALLAVSGAVLQGVFRNALAEPYILGVVGGAGLFASFAALCGWTAVSALVLPAASFLGSCLSLGLVALVALVVARRRREQGGDGFLRASYSTVVLSGFVVNGLAGSLEMLILSYAKPATVKAIEMWLFGTVADLTPSAVALGALALAVVGLVLYAFRRELNVMELGAGEAACLGVNTTLTLVVVLAVVALATAVSVALAGMIGFVGLVMPHFARRLVGPRMSRVLPVAAVLGGLVLLVAEALAAALPATESGATVGVGVICAILSAPFMLALLLSRRNGEGRDV